MKIRLKAVFCLLITLWSAQISLAGVDIASAAALRAALQSVRGGEVLMLAPGDYGALKLAAPGFDVGKGRPVLIRSADPGNPARFSGLVLNGVARLGFQDVVFDYTFAAGDSPLRTRPFRISESRDIVIRNALFDGDLAFGAAPHDNGFGAGQALFVQGVQNIVLEGSEFRHWYKGAIFTESSGILVRGNDLHAIRSDGLNFSAVRSVRVEANHIHDFNRSPNSPDHADMIQVWTEGTKTPTRDLVIADNILNSGAGFYTQSIYMRNEVVDKNGAGKAMYYRDIRIENNVIINAHLHGITVGAVDGLIIRGNTLIRNRASQGRTRGGGAGGDQVSIPVIAVKPASKSVTIRDNVAADIQGPKGQPDWDVAGNVVIQDTAPGKPGYYDKVFVAARSGNPQDLASFAYRPGGPLAGGQAGASQLRRR